MATINIHRVKSVTVEPVSKARLHGYECTLEIETAQGGFSITLQADSREALDFLTLPDTDEVTGPWPASKLPTCDRCGHAPTVDETGRVGCEC